MLQKPRLNSSHALIGSKELQEMVGESVTLVTPHLYTGARRQNTSGFCTRHGAFPSRVSLRSGNGRVPLQPTNEEKRSARQTAPGERRVDFRGLPLGTEPAVGSATLLNWASRLLRMFDLVAGEMGWKVLTEFAAPKQSRAILCWNYNCPGVLINELRTRKIAQDNAEGWEGF